MLDLEVDGMKSPGMEDEPEKVDSPEEEMGEDEDGMMAIEALNKNDGAAFAEAIRRIVGK